MLGRGSDEVNVGKSKDTKSK